MKAGSGLFDQFSAVGPPLQRTLIPQKVRPYPSGTHPGPTLLGSTCSPCRVFERCRPATEPPGSCGRAGLFLDHGERQGLQMRRISGVPRPEFRWGRFLFSWMVGKGWEDTTASERCQSKARMVRRHGLVSTT